MTLPLSDEPVNAKNYQDLNTGCIYELNETTGEYFLVYCPPSSGGGIILGNYRWNTARGGAPASGRARLESNPAVGVPNFLLLSETEVGGDIRTPYLSMITPGDTVWVDDGAGDLIKVVVTDPVLDQGSYWVVPFTPDGSGTEPPDNAAILISLVEASGGGGGGGADTVPPAAPTLSSLVSAITPGPGGGTLVEVRATVVHPTDTDLFGTHVLITSENNEDPVSPSPIWLNAAVVLVSPGETVGVLKGVAGSTRYWAKAHSRDLSGNQSADSAVLDHTTVKDVIAPPIPVGLEAIAGYRSVGLTWDPSTAQDLMFNEIRYAPDLTGAPDTTADTWLSPPLRVRTNTVVIGNLPVPDPATPFWFEVRAVDQSGNVATSAVDSTALDYLAYPDAGWSPAVSATPSLIGAEDMAFDEIVTNFLTSGEIDAGMITSGTIKVVTTGDGADGIEVWNGGIKVGFWDETGLYVGTDEAGLPTDLTSSDYVQITDAGLTVHLNGYPVSAITPEGINATAINFGSLPGGMNLVKNSSFELAPFPTTVPAGKDWNVAADWSGTQQTNTNATNGTNALSVTGTSY